MTIGANLNEQAEERLDLIIEQMKAAEGVTEGLKARNLLYLKSYVGRQRERGRMDDCKLTVYNGCGAFKKLLPHILL